MTVSQFLYLLAKEAAPYTTVTLAMMAVDALGKITKDDEALAAIHELKDLEARNILDDPAILELANDIARQA